jgi:hypothetical protein
MHYVMTIKLFVCPNPTRSKQKAWPKRRVWPSSRAWLGGCAIANWLSRSRRSGHQLCLPLEMKYLVDGGTYFDCLDASINRSQHAKDHHSDIRAFLESSSRNSLVVQHRGIDETQGNTRSEYTLIHPNKETPRGLTKRSCQQTKQICPDPLLQICSQRRRSSRS